MALPTNQPIHPARNTGAAMRGENEEQPFHPICDYALITDAREGLILTNVDTLADGEPRNNFLRRALTWNPDGILDGARHLTIRRHYAYIMAKAGLVILNLDQPLQPRVESVVPLNDGRASALQFRYLFFTDAQGLLAIDATDPKHPRTIEYPTQSPALSLSKGLDRDRAVDETGHQIAVFGRRGSGPLSLKDSQRLYLNPDGSPWFVEKTDVRHRPNPDVVTKGGD